MDSILNVAEVQLSYKSNVKSSTRYKINSSLDVYEYKESFKVVLLNQSNKVLGIVPISEGGISATYVDVRLILQAALLANATQVILAHNHPSGSMKPSTLDDVLTEKVRKVAELMEIHVADHIILSPEKEYYSYHDEGKL